MGSRYREVFKYLCLMLVGFGISELFLTNSFSLLKSATKNNADLVILINMVFRWRWIINLYSGMVLVSFVHTISSIFQAIRGTSLEKGDIK
jgi:hypothetical protein